jgi:C4-dicarboxylate-specific signal transduction histidine kinase
MPTESPTETLVLRTAFRELIALSAIPAAWVGREPAIIAAGLAEVLMGSVQLDFAFVRFCDSAGGTAAEATRGNAWTEFPEWLRDHLATNRRFLRTQIFPDFGRAEPCRGILIPIGVNAEIGLLAAACSRGDFPSETDQLLLSVAANHAGVAFQNTQLRNELDLKIAELSHARNELEIKVVERTADLRRSESYLSDAQKLTHTGTWAWKISGKEVTYSSEEHCRLHGFDRSKGLPSYEQFLERIHPDDRAGLIDILEKAVRAGTDFEVHFRSLLPDGTTNYLCCIGHPVLNDSGEVVQYLGITTDVTERRRADEERERLRQVQADLAYLSRVTTMGELTASLAHEIRQPITAAVTDAKTCLRWLRRECPDLEAASKAASRIVKDVTSAAEIISSVCLLFKKGPGQRELVDVNELIREMIVLLRSEANRYSISLRTDLAEDLPRVMADRVQLQQVFMNLMLNGIDAMKEAGGENELIIKSAAEDGQLLISVSDTGVGFPPEQADQIFGAFFTTKENGIGMGLAISRSIIESHSGRLWAIAGSGRGATFQFILPASTAAAHA